MKISSFLLSVFLCLVLFACSKKDNNTSTPPVTNATAVKIENFAFAAPSVTVKAGSTVTWTNDDATAHTVTANDGSFDSGSLGKDGTYSFTFTKAGTYAYHCSFHSMMTGTVVVQ